MGEIAGELADLLHSHQRQSPQRGSLRNPQGRSRRAFATPRCAYTVIENRREAIRAALEMARPSDVVVLAGKGHETYQEIKGVKHPFDEKIVVAELLSELRG